MPNSTNNQPPSANNQTPPSMQAAEPMDIPPIPDPNSPVITTSEPHKKFGGGNGKIIATILGIFFLLGGVATGIILVRQRQQLNERAASQCPAAEACPGPDGVLRNCHPPESDNSPAESLCNSSFMGRIEFCGSRNYCCNGSSWTANMAACTTPTPTPTPKPTPTPTPTSTPTPTPTPTTTATPTATPTGSGQLTSTPTPTPTSTPPIPETGGSWPSFVGIGLGFISLMGAVLLAF